MSSIQLNFSDISSLECFRLKKHTTKSIIHVRSTKKKSSKRLFNKSRNINRFDKLLANNETYSPVCTYT